MPSTVGPLEAPSAGVAAATDCGLTLAALRSELQAAREEILHLRRALDTSRDIGAAVGIVMALHKVTQAEAFELLRRSSQDSNTKLARLALEVLETGALPPPRQKQASPSR